MPNNQKGGNKSRANPRKTNKSKTGVKSRVIPSKLNKVKPIPLPKSNKAKAKPKSKPKANVKVNLRPCQPPEPSKAMQNQPVQANSTKVINGRPPVCYHAEKGPRDYMEDTYQIMHFTFKNKKGTFYGVFDGHGGKDVSAMLVQKNQGLFPFLIECFKRYEGKKIENILRAGFLAYDEKLFNKKLKAGSTACVVLHYANKIYIANLGDSRALIFTQDEKLSKVSQDHKPWLAVEKKRIYQAGYFVNPFKIYYTKSKKSYDNGDIFVDTKARKHYIYLEKKWELITGDQFKQILSMNEDYDTHRVCNSLALSRAFGDFYLKKDKENKYMGLKSAISPEPDVDILDLSGHKNKMLYILIGSDGFWDVNYVTKGLKQLLKTPQNGKMLCQKLVHDSLRKGSQDNTTVVFDKFKI